MKKLLVCVILFIFVTVQNSTLLPHLSASSLQPFQKIGVYTLNNSVNFIGNSVQGKDGKTYLFIYSDSYSRRLIRVDALAGSKLVWSFKFPSDVNEEFVSISKSGDLTFVNRENSKNYIISGKTGKVLKMITFQAMNALSLDIRIDSKENLYIYDGEQSLKKFSSAGKLLWTFKSDLKGIEYIISKNDDIYVWENNFCSTCDNYKKTKLYALNQQGEIKWTVLASAPFANSVLLTNDGNVLMNEDQFVKDTHQFIGNEVSLKMLNGSTGELLWENSQTSFIGEPIYVSKDGTIFTDKLFNYDKQTGEYNIDILTAFSPSDGHILYSTNLKSGTGGNMIIRENNQDFIYGTNAKSNTNQTYSILRLNSKGLVSTVQVPFYVVDIIPISNSSHLIGGWSNLSNRSKGEGQFSLIDSKGKLTFTQYFKTPVRSMYYNSFQNMVSVVTEKQLVIYQGAKR